MKKIFSKVIAFAFIICASIALFACGKSDKKETQEQMKTKLTDAYTYLTLNDHIIYETDTDGDPDIVNTSYNYHYNNGNYETQIIGTDGTLGQVTKAGAFVYQDDDITSRQYVRYYDASKSTEANKDQMLSGLANLGSSQDFYQAIIDSTETTYALKDAKVNLYTATLTTTIYEEKIKITATFDNTKLLSIVTDFYD